MIGVCQKLFVAFILRGLIISVCLVLHFTRISYYMFGISGILGSLLDSVHPFRWSLFQYCEF